MTMGMTTIMLSRLSICLGKILSANLSPMVSFPVQFLSVVPLMKFNIAGKLNERDISILRAYTFKVGEHITDKAFAKIPLAFPKEPTPSVKVCRARLQALSG